MSSITHTLRTLARTLPEGAPLTASQLLHLGNRAAIDQALARLTKRGELLRVGRGIYVAPVISRFGIRPPSPEKLIEAWAQQQQETVVPNEAAAANAMGISTQVPVRQVYLTSGKSRFLRLGRQSLELRHAPSWKLRNANRPAGQALRALVHAGPSQAPAVAQQLASRLNLVEREALAKTSTLHMPTWVSRELRGLLMRG